MSRLGEGEKESKGDFWAVRRRRQQLGTHSKAAVQQVRTAEFGTHSKAVFGTISKRPYSSFSTDFEAAKGLFYLARISRQAVQQVAVPLHGNRGRFRTASFCCPLARISRSVQQHLLLFCTDFEVAVPLHLLQIFGHEKRGNPYSIYCCSCFAVCTFSEAVVKHGKRDKLYKFTC